MHQINIDVFKSCVARRLNRAMRRMGADVIINMTNDAWFGPTKESHAHLALGRMRAIETRMPIVRSTNTGVSAFVGVDGQIQLASDQDVEATMRREVVIKDVGSLYVRVGKWPFWACVAGCAGWMALHWRRSRVRGETP